ncbi:uncharacterized protein LOC135835250 [Planococcus citri]|uniref:uncharacterized protein LOC135835250 n=1 Tax=Planococcus citri TaxID=170843 RepID=UPI0031FA3B25
MTRHGRTYTGPVLWFKLKMCSLFSFLMCFSVVIVYCASGTTHEGEKSACMKNCIPKVMNIFSKRAKESTSETPKPKKSSPKFFSAVKKFISKPRKDKNRDVSTKDKSKSSGLQSLLEKLKKFKTGKRTPANWFHRTRDKSINPKFVQNNKMPDSTLPKDHTLEDDNTEEEKYHTPLSSPEEYTTAPQSPDPTTVESNGIGEHIIKNPQTSSIHESNEIASSSKAPANDLNDHATEKPTVAEYLPLTLEQVVKDAEDNYLQYPEKLSPYFDRKTLEIQINKDEFRKIIFFCPREESSQNRALYENRGDFSSTQPRCSIEPNPIIQKVFLDTENANGGEDSSDDQEPCGPPTKKGKLYSYGYKIILMEEYEEIMQEETFEDSEVDLYWFCYDHKHRETLYTHHKIYSPRLLQDKYMKKELAMTFDMKTNDDDDQFKYISKSHKKQKNIFKVMQKTYQSSFNAGVPSSNNPQFLVPSDDLAFAVWKKTTYHYVNVRPMHQKLIKLWNLIGDLIRDDAAKYNAPYEIYTGAFKVTDGRRSKAQYVYKHRIRKPEIWIKILYVEDRQHKRYGLAILMLNDITKDSPINLDEYCERDYCVISSRQDEIFSEFIDVSHTLRCCQISEKILELFNIVLNVDHELVIEGLIASQFWPD